MSKFDLDSESYPDDWTYPDVIGTTSNHQFIVEKEEVTCEDCNGESSWDGVNDEGDVVRIYCRCCGGNGYIIRYTYIDR